MSLHYTPDYFASKCVEPFILETTVVWTCLGVSLLVCSFFLFFLIFSFFLSPINRRKARYERAHFNGTNERLHIIELFNDKKYYEINLDTGACRSGNLQYPFVKHGVPSNGTFRGDFIIGTTAIDGAGVEIETWTEEFEHDSQKFYWLGEFTRVGCIPVRTVVQGDRGDFFSEAFADVVPGIPDPNAFIVPSSCN